VYSFLQVEYFLCGCVQLFENGFFTGENRLLRQVSNSQVFSLVKLTGIRRLYSDTVFKCSC